MKPLVVIMLSFWFLATFSQPLDHPVDYGMTGIPPAVTVGDFTVITTTGDTLNLYDNLDSGKTVFIDLFYTTCANCQFYAPVIEQVFQNTGAGEDDILFWGISNDTTDTDSLIDLYKTEFGISNPCAGPEGNGQQAFNIIVSGQNFFGYPTYCIICPDGSMFFDALYPPTVTGFDPYFEECAATVAIDENEALQPVIKLSVYPNPAGDRVIAQWDLQPSQYYNQLALVIIDEYGREIKTYRLGDGEKKKPVTVSGYPEGIYLAILKNSQGIVSRAKFVISR